MKRKLEGLTNRETAKAMGISSGRVDQLYQAGLQRMKRRAAEAAA